MSLQYYDTFGALQTVDPSLYLVRTPARVQGTIERAPSSSFPAVQGDRRYPVYITFTAGYGAPAQVPATIKQAVLLVIGWLYANREPTAWEMDAVRALLMSEGYGFYG